MHNQKTMQYINQVCHNISKHHIFSGSRCVHTHGMHQVLMGVQLQMMHELCHFTEGAANKGGLCHHPFNFESLSRCSRVSMGGFNMVCHHSYEPLCQYLHMGCLKLMPNHMMRIHSHVQRAWQRTLIKK